MIEVAAVRIPEARYPADAPFHPSTAYPEYPFGDRRIARESNLVYDGVRDVLRQLGLDRERFGTRDWNPLGGVVLPGTTVVLKPNFVLSRHPRGGDLFSIVTHPSVLRAVADYCWIALKGSGRIIVADAPQYDCHFEELMAASKLPEVIAFYRSERGASADLFDLRPYWSPGKHFASMLVPLPGDPAGSVMVDLAGRSALEGKAHREKLYGAVYRRQETIEQHTGGHHRYAVSKTILGADAVISIPKLKVHKKVGTTLNAKGLVGMATNKNHLVHYSLTPPSEGGDQYPDGLLTPVERLLIRTERWMYDHLLAAGRRPLEYLHRSTYWLHNHSTRLLGLKVDESKRMLDAGNWHGNDSAWRMTIDLLRIFHFADVNGRLHDTPQRRMFSIVDGIVGGQRNGPLSPEAARSRTLVGGANLLAVDLVATRLMGFDPLRLRLYRAALADPQFAALVPSLDAVRVLSSEPGWTECLTDRTSRFLGFEPHPGWVGHVEATFPPQEAA